MKSNRTVLGWALYDWGNSAFSPSAMNLLLPFYLKSVFPEEGALFPWFGGPAQLPSDVVWAYLVAGIAFASAVLSPILGAAADLRGTHKRGLLTFTLFGCVATAALALTGSLPLALGWIGIAVLCFSLSQVFYSSMLLDIAPKEEHDRVSSYGSAWGYAGGGTVMALCMFLLMFHQSLGLESVAAASRFAFVAIAGWWAFFTLPLLRWVPETVPAARESVEKVSVALSFKRLWQTLTHLRRYRQLLLFLIAYLLFNDGIQTVLNMAAPFAHRVLQMSEQSMAGCLLMVQGMALFGAILFGRLAGPLGAKRTITVTLTIWLGILLYAYRIQTQTEFWVMAALVGLVLGGTAPLARSMFAGFVPPDRAAEFFGFLTASSKFASFIGPLVYGMVLNATGDARPAILSMAVLFVFGILVLSQVDVEKGREEALVSVGSRQ
ncbi:MAG: MFS transporter [Armatimonadetes bacterium]|nr:MFS transporter [Armatimonadota bacterium]